MSVESRRRHWESVWSRKSTPEMGWYQDDPEPSLGLILAALPERRGAIVDVGGGDSLLIEHLQAAGLRDLTVLDVSAAALARAQRRLGARAAEVEWIEADVSAFRPRRAYDLWHDRAVFHFLTEADDRAAYRRALGAALAEGGQAVISTFSLAGPARCSGLDVVRYSADTLTAELGPELALIDVVESIHRTPGGSEQAFVTCRFERVRRRD